MSADAGSHASDAGARSVADGGPADAGLERSHDGGTASGARDGGTHHVAATGDGPAVAPSADAGTVAVATVDAGAIATATPDAGPSVALGTTPDAGSPTGAGPATPAADSGASHDDVSSRHHTGAIVRTIGGLVLVVVLAWLGGLPWVRRLERVLGISQVVTAGFPFVALGLVAHDARVGILTDEIVRELAPVLQLGLGWIGFLTGFQLNVRSFESFPKGTARLVVLMTAGPFGLVVAACGALMLAFGQPWRDAIFLRDAIVLGSAATITAPIAARLAEERGVAPETQDAVMRIGLLDDIAGVLGLLFLGAYFRPTDDVGTWTLPDTAWLFVTVGLGVVVGLVGYVILRRRTNGTEKIALLLGIVAFCAGMAGYLRLSPIVVCFLAGAILGNGPGDYHAAVRSVLRQLERPIYLLLLVIAGALWNVRDWHGWLLLPAFVFARLGGRLIGARLAQRTAEGAVMETDEHGVVAAPMGALSIAIVVSFQLLFSGRAVPWIVTAVIGSAIVTEVLVQVTALSGRKREEPTIPEVR